MVMTRDFYPMKRLELGFAIFDGGAFKVEGHRRRKITVVRPYLNKLKLAYPIRKETL